ncbi:MAG: lamin tail domain-containing protein, partial [Planctomycetales bacterium]|nr:lamin tail domain-containing protein [Planctomycetales bacterium]
MIRRVRHSKGIVSRLRKTSKLRKNRMSLAEILEPRCVLDGVPVISEFQAANESTITDGNGNHSDWIEVRNPTTDSMDIGGYYLTDDAADLRQWKIPDNTSLKAGEHLVIFASGEDQPDAEGNLHTNFRLSSGGEFLALVGRDGVTVTQSFDPYPSLLTDQSYGIASERAVKEFVTNGSTVKTFVPTSDSLGTSWTQVGFNDAAWSPGTTAVGFEVPQVGVNLTDEFDAPLSADWTVDLPAESASTVKVENGNLVIDSPVGELSDYNDRGKAPIVHRSLPNPEAADFEIITHVIKRGEDDGAAGIAIIDSSTGTPAIQLEYDEDRYFKLFAGGLLIDDLRDTGEDEFTLRLVRDGLEKTWTAYTQKPGATDWRDVGTATDGVDGVPVIGASTVGLYTRTANGTMQAQFSRIDMLVPDQRPVYGPEISANVSAMRNTNSSIYMRMPFNVDVDPANLDEMTLSVRYDDGFVAYLNGTKITEQNAPIDATWNSQAAGTYGAVGGNIPEQDILLGHHLDLLKQGENVLAIHGMNVSANDSDFFFDAELTAAEILGESLQFFVSPTPGKPNHLPAAPTPEIVGEDGIFFTQKTIELSVPDGFEIRYTLDGSPPKADSTLYSGPFVINQSARLQAIAYDTSVDPEFVPSNQLSGTYFAVDESLRGRTSDLPIIILDTLGQSLQGTSSTTLSAMNVIVIDVDKATGRATIDEGKIDYLGRGGARDRGSSSSGLRKPNMAFETWGASGTGLDDDENVSILGMDPDSDWVFYAGTSYDPTEFHNQYAFNLSNQIGQWAPDYRNVEVFANMRWQTNRDTLETVGTEDYYGVYAIMEKISQGSHRVDVASIDSSVTKTPEEAAPGEPNISGGYIWKIDRADPGNEGTLTVPGASLNWVYPKSPRDANADPDQKANTTQEAWIQDYFGGLRDSLREPNINDPEGYTKFIDLESWAEHHMLNVLTFNVDAFRLSGYLQKDRDSKIVYGPVWDFDRALNSTDGRDADPFVWKSRVGDGGTDFFNFGYYNNLFDDPGFWQYYVDTWHKLRDDEFSDQNLHALVDELAGEMRESIGREREDCSHCSGIRPRGGYENELAMLKQWLSDRAGFINSNFAPVPLMFSGDDVLDRTQDGVYVSPGHEVAVTPIVRINNDTPIVDGTNGVADASFMVPVNDDLGDSWTALNFDDAAWQKGKLGVGFGTSSGFEENYTTVIDPRDVNPDATNIFIRVPFTLDNLDGLDELVLRMKYDDGFVAYLNGEKVLETNIRDVPVAWDSRANSHRNSEAIEFEDFDVSEFADKLKIGENVLAIRGINQSRTSGDMLMQPALVKRRVTFDPAPTGTVYYTTDGTDPRGPDGNPSASAKALARNTKITVNENTRIIARNFDETDRGSESRIVLTDWSGPTTHNFIVQQSDLVISEINYNPASATQAESDAGFGNDDFEFVEIYNAGTATASLVGVELNDGVDIDLLDAPEIPAGGFAVVVRNADAFRMRYGNDIAIAGVYSGELANDGEDIDLIDGTGKVLFSVNYGDNDPWAVRADGFGATLELINPAGTNAATQNKWYSWRASTEMNGTPGRASTQPIGVVINEVLANATCKDSDTIELHNTTGAGVDIGGWTLSDSFDDLDKFTIPAGTTIPAGGYVTFDEDDFDAKNPVNGNVGFKLSGSGGDNVWLTVLDAGGAVTAFVDDVHFRETFAGESLGRMPNGTGRLAPLSATTFGAENTAPRVGPVIISEVQYNPKVSGAALA